MYVSEGMFDLGITGRDWIEETSSNVESLGELQYSKATSRPIRMVVAVAGDSKSSGWRTSPNGVRVSTEYPVVTRRFFEYKGIEADIRLSYGATEAKIPDIVDCIVEITETGRALRAAGSQGDRPDPAELHRAGRQPGRVRRSGEGPRHGPDPHPARRASWRPGARSWSSSTSAPANLDAVIELLPSMKSPTVSKLHGDGGYAVETVVPKREINILIPALKDAGASDIIELPLAKIVH